MRVLANEGASIRKYDSNIVEKRFEFDRRRETHNTGQGSKGSENPAGNMGGFLMELYTRRKWVIMEEAESSTPIVQVTLEVSLDSPDFWH